MFGKNTKKPNFVRVPMNNGQPKPQPAPTGKVAPYVKIFCDPTIANAQNPSGINIQTNMNAANLPGWELMVIQLIGDGLVQWAEAVKQKKLAKVATGLVMPNGQPAVIEDVAEPATE